MASVAMTADKPKVSIVVASYNARASVEECLTMLGGQRSEGGTEIIVVDNSTDGTTEIIRRRFHSVRLVAGPSSALIPELWETGIRHSTADIVAITTAHCVPGNDWVARMLHAHDAPVPAIGGAIENDGSASIVDWAVYFCRYSRYMLPFPEGFVTEIPGENASYKREHIDRCQHARRNGFWESVVHAELKKAGFQLLLVPSIVVYHKRSYGFSGFLKQRFRHAMEFGRWRTSEVTSSQRALHIAFCPAIPFVLLVRIVRQVLTKRRYRTKLLVALPLLVLFLLAWTLGELFGYLRGPTR